MIKSIMLVFVDSTPSLRLNASGDDGATFHQHTAGMVKKDTDSDCYTFYPWHRIREVRYLDY